MAPVIGRAAEGRIIQLERHEFRAEGPVKDEDPPGERFEVVGRHATSFGVSIAGRTIHVHKLLY